MILKKEFQDKNSATIYCSASITKDYIVLKADDYFYNFVGRQVGLKFDVYIHPDYVEEFKECVESIEVGAEARILSIMKDVDNVYRLVDIIVHNDGDTMSGKEIIDIRICNLMSMEFRYIRSRNNILKYRTFLSMYDDILFDYDYEKDMFTMLKYFNSKINILLKDTFENAKARLLSIMDDDETKSAIETVFEKIKSNCESFSVELSGPDYFDRNKTVHYNINARSIYKHNRTKVSAGIVRREDEELNIPYYNKPEARDHFTGAYNKKGSEELVKDFIKRGKNKHYLVMMDIDNFKNVNDEYGHKVGDEVILKVAEIINKAIAGRGFVGRFGGDEFFVFTNGINDEIALRSVLTFIKQMMVKEFEKRFGGNGLTCSMGVCEYPKDGDNYNKLFVCADKCLYIAKEKGKNRYIIYDREKHGSVDESDDLSTGINAMQLDNNKMTDMVADITSEIISSKGEKIIELLNDIKKAFSIDGIRIYHLDDKEEKGLKLYSGDYRDMSKIESIEFAKEVDAIFAADDTNSIAIIGNLELTQESLYKANLDAGIGGYYAVRHTSENGGKILVFFDTIGKKCNFSQSSRNYARLLTNVISKFK